jgi:hypothetical protein
LSSRRANGPTSSRDLAARLWQAVSPLGKRDDLRRVRLFLDAFGANETVAPLDRRQRSAAGRFFPGLKAEPWYNPELVAGASALSAAFDAIARDYLSLCRRGTLFVSYEDAEEHAVGRAPDARTGRQDDIDVFVTHLPDQLLRRNLEFCPGVKQAVGGEWFAGASMFSVLREKNFVGPHSDFINYIVTLQLGIRTPEGAGIRVGGETSWWTKGECLAFDASFVHEVWNDGPGERTVLIVDTWHPELTAIEIAALKTIRPRIREWEKAKLAV